MLWRSCVSKSKTGDQKNITDIPLIGVLLIGRALHTETKTGGDMKDPVTKGREGTHLKGTHHGLHFWIQENQHGRKSGQSGHILGNDHTQSITQLPTETTLNNILHPPGKFHDHALGNILESVHLLLKLSVRSHHPE